MLPPFFDADHMMLRARVGAWVEQRLMSRSGASGSGDARPLQLVRELGSEGFLKYVVPQEFGGVRRAVQARDLCILREQIARGDVLADTMFAMQALGCHPLALAGSESQKRGYLPRVASGDAIAAFAITEPEAGSDVAAIRTEAVRQQGGFLINGTKRFISNAGIADFYVVFASSGREEKSKSNSVSAFVLDAAAPGFTVKEKIELLSPHPIGVVEFSNCLVDNDSLLGTDGEGLQIAFAALDLMRCTVGAAAVGMAQRALDEAIHFSKTRRQFGRAIAEFQGIEFKLAEMATELEAARLLVYEAAWSHDCGRGDSKVKSSMAKLFATEAAQRIVDQALQIHGGAGLIAGSIMERLYRDVRALRIYEGTSEIQKVIIARELLKATGNRQ